MPHCVLCLRLIGVAMDCYDGSRPEGELSKDQVETKLPTVPSLLEMTSHVFYLGSYFVGPQFGMTKFRYISFDVNDIFVSNCNQLSNYFFLTKQKIQRTNPNIQAK